MRELGGGECHSYQISLSENQFLQFVVEQKGIDVVLAIYSQDGAKLCEVDRPNGSRGPEIVSFIAPADGFYLLSIRSLEEVTTSGKYDLTVMPLRIALPGDASEIKAERLVSEGEVLRSANSMRAALAKFKEAADLWRSLEKPYEEALALYGAGFSCSSVGDNQAAIDYFERALSIFVQLKNPAGEAMVKTALGWPYLYLSELDSALENFSQGLQIYQAEQNVRGEGVCLYGLGWVHALRGENQKALQKFSESLNYRQKAMDRRGEALTLTGIGKVESRLGDLAGALNSLSLALNVLPKPQRYAEADILSNLGWVHEALNENDKAMSLFKTALAIRTEIGDSVGEVTTRYGMSIVHHRNGRLSEAEQEIENALKIIESLRAKGSNQQLRISYFASVQEYYEYYITLLVELDQLHPSRGYAAKALQACESARARGLLDLLAEAKVDVRQEIGAELLDRKQVNSERLNVVRPLSAAEIQREILDEDTLLLQYVLSEKGSFLLAVTPAEITTYALPSRTLIESMARQFYEASTLRNRLDVHESPEELRAKILQSDLKANALAADLSRTLLGPVANKLTKKRLVVLASGTLQFIPFAALPLPSQLDSEAKRGLLVDNYEVVVLPSVSALSAIRQEVRIRTRPPKAVLVLADPVFDSSDDRLGEPYAKARTPAVEYPRLISSRWEGEQILSLAPPGEGKLVVDFAANNNFASSVEFGRYRIIHFATHAVIDFERPALSGIVLSMVDQKGKPQNGFLGLDDIFKLKMPVDLVVLSGCRTALGKDYAGEGLVGLTRAFMYAGASRIAVSLWHVADKPTSELMVRFYRYMLGPQKLAPSAALRAAQLELRSDPRWHSPYFWAPFVIEGDWR